MISKITAYGWRYSFIILILCYSCGGGDSPPTQEQEKQAPAVSVKTIFRQTFPVILELSGNIRPWEQVFITGTAGNRINEIYVDVGDNVRKGKLLVLMNAAQLQQVKAQLELAEKNLNRLDTLLQIGSVSQQQFDQAQAEYRSTLNNYQQLLENTRLTAPFSGTITEKHFYEGEQYSPSAQTPSILTLMQLDPVKLVVNISEDYYTEIDQGMSVSVTVDNYPDTTFQGSVYKKYPTIDETTRTFTTEIMIDNDKKLLRPGMYAEAEVVLEEEEGLYVPVSAIVSQPGTTNEFLYVIRNDSAHRVQVETGNRYQDLVLIESVNIQPGDRLVTEGMGKLDASGRVRIVNSSDEMVINK